MVTTLSSSSALIICQSRTSRSWVENPSLQPSLRQPLSRGQVGAGLKIRLFNQAYVKPLSRGQVGAGLKIRLFNQAYVKPLSRGQVGAGLKIRLFNQAYVSL